MSVENIKEQRWELLTSVRECDDCGRMIQPGEDICITEPPESELKIIICDECADLRKTVETGVSH